MRIYKYRIAGNFHMVLIFVYRIRISYECSVCEIKTTKIWTIGNFAWALTTQHARWRIASLVFYQIFEQPIQRSISISQQKVKRVINLEIEHHAVLQAILIVGKLHGLAALAYEIKTYGNLSCGGFGQICENLHQQNFPAIQYSMRFRLPALDQSDCSIWCWISYQAKCKHIFLLLKKCMICVYLTYL